MSEKDTKKKSKSKKSSIKDEIRPQEEQYMPKVIIYTDGAAKGNPGDGAYATHIELLSPKGVTLKVLEFAQKFPNTTNNKMEILGVIVGIENLKIPSQVDVFTDSNYVVKAFTDKWLENWESNGWKTSSDAPVKNVEYWKRLRAAIKPHKVSWHWVKGHSGDPLNERVDFLASATADGRLFERSSDGTLVEKSFELEEIDKIKELESIFDDFMNPPSKD